MIEPGEQDASVCGPYDNIAVHKAACRARCAAGKTASAEDYQQNLCKVIVACPAADGAGAAPGTQNSCTRAPLPPKLDGTQATDDNPGSIGIHKVAVMLVSGLLPCACLCIS